MVTSPLLTTKPLWAPAEKMGPLLVQATTGATITAPGPLPVPCTSTG